ncbi:MAG: amidohydrolase family protein, partial [Vicinamibacteria bacterium]
MTKYTRSEFLRISGAGAAGLGLGGFPARAQSGGSVDETRPDLVLVNGRVLTMDDELARAEAFAVKNGRFVAVGSNDDVRNLVSPGTEVIDAEGMTVTPGFIDAHSHPASGGSRMR